MTRLRNGHFGHHGSVGAKHGTNPGADIYCTCVSTKTVDQITTRIANGMKEGGKLHNTPASVASAGE